MSSATVLADALSLARKASRAFGLTRRRLLVVPKEPKRGMREDGCCFRQGPKRLKWAVIELRVHRSHRPRQALKRSTIMAALAHELAHLKVDDHNAAHGELTRKIAGWLKEQGQPVGHVLHSNTATAFLPLHKQPKRARIRRFKRGWARAVARS
jgi:hypothetical protein